MLGAGAGLPATGADASGSGDVPGVGDASGDSTCSAGKPCAMRSLPRERTRAMR